MTCLHLKTPILFENLLIFQKPPSLFLKFSFASLNNNNRNKLESPAEAALPGPLHNKQLSFDFVYNNTI